MGRYRLGVDIGGTFTDFSLLDERSGELIGIKTPTVPGAPAEGVANGLRLLAERGVDLGEIDTFVHGTTIAVNTAHDHHRRTDYWARLVPALPDSALVDSSPVDQVAFVRR